MPPPLRSPSAWTDFISRRIPLLLSLWCIVIFALSSVPGNKYPQVQWDFADKVVHVLLYVAGGFLATAWISQKRRHLSGGFFFATFYGVTDEVHQLFVPRRTFSTGDLLADWTGAAIGAAVFLLFALYSHKLLPSVAPTVLRKNRERMNTT